MMMMMMIAKLCHGLVVCQWTALLIV